MNIPEIRREGYEHCKRDVVQYLKALQKAAETSDEWTFFERLMGHIENGCHENYGEAPLTEDRIPVITAFPPPLDPEATASETPLALANAVVGELDW